MGFYLTPAFPRCLDLVTSMEEVRLPTYQRICCMPRVSLSQFSKLLQDDLYGGDIYDTVAEPVLPAATTPADDSSKRQVTMPETDVAFLCASQNCWLCFTVSTITQVPVKVQEPTPMEDDGPARYLLRALHRCVLATALIGNLLGPQHTCQVYKPHAISFGNSFPSPAGLRHQPAA